MSEEQTMARLNIDLVVQLGNAVNGIETLRMGFVGLEGTITGFSRNLFAAAGTIDQVTERSVEWSDTNYQLMRSLEAVGLSTRYFSKLAEDLAKNTRMTRVEAQGLTQALANYKYPVPQSDKFAAALKSITDEFGKEAPAAIQTFLDAAEQMPPLLDMIQNRGKLSNDTISTLGFTLSQSMSPTQVQTILRILKPTSADSDTKGIRSVADAYEMIRKNLDDLITTLASSDEFATFMATLSKVGKALTDGLFQPILHFLATRPWLAFGIIGVTLSKGLVSAYRDIRVLTQGFGILTGKVKNATKSVTDLNTELAESAQIPPPGSGSAGGTEAASNTYPGVTQRYRKTQWPGKMIGGRPTGPYTGDFKFTLGRDMGVTSPARTAGTAQKRMFGIWPGAIDSVKSKWGGVGGTSGIATKIGDTVKTTGDLLQMGMAAKGTAELLSGNLKDGIFSLIGSLNPVGAAAIGLAQAFAQAMDDIENAADKNFNDRSKGGKKEGNDLQAALIAKQQMGLKVTDAEIKAAAKARGKSISAVEVARIERREAMNNTWWGAGIRNTMGRLTGDKTSGEYRKELKQNKKDALARGEATGEIQTRELLAGKDRFGNKLAGTAALANSPAAAASRIKLYQDQLATAQQLTRRNEANLSVARARGAADRTIQSEQQKQLPSLQKQADLYQKQLDILEKEAKAGRGNNEVLTATQESLARIKSQMASISVESTQWKESIAQANALLEARATKKYYQTASVLINPQIEASKAEAKTLHQEAVEAFNAYKAGLKNPQLGAKEKQARKETYLSKREEWGAAEMESQKLGKIGGVDVKQFELAKEVMDTQIDYAKIVPTSLGLQFDLAKKKYAMTMTELAAQKDILKRQQMWSPQWVETQQKVLGLTKQQAQEYMDLTGGLANQFETILGQFNLGAEDLDAMMPRFGDIAKMSKVPEELKPQWKYGSFGNGQQPVQWQTLSKVDNPFTGRNNVPVGLEKGTIGELATAIGSAVAKSMGERTQPTTTGTVAHIGPKR